MIILFKILIIGLFSLHASNTLATDRALVPKSFCEADLLNQPLEWNTLFGDGTGAERPFDTNIVQLKNVLSEAKGPLLKMIITSPSRSGKTSILGRVFGFERMGVDFLHVPMIGADSSSLSAQQVKEYFFDHVLFSASIDPSSPDYTGYKGWDYKKFFDSLAGHFHRHHSEAPILFVDELTIDTKPYRELARALLDQMSFRIILSYPTTQHHLSEKTRMANPKLATEEQATGFITSAIDRFFGADSNVQRFAMLPETNESIRQYIDQNAAGATITDEAVDLLRRLTRGRPGWINLVLSSLPDGLRVVEKNDILSVAIESGLNRRLPDMDSALKVELDLFRKKSPK